MNFLARAGWGIVAVLLLSAGAGVSSITADDVEEKSPANQEMLELLELGSEESESELEDEEGSSVNISESYEFSSKQNIDGFLPDLERGFSSPDESYDGSRSERRQQNTGIGF